MIKTSFISVSVAICLTSLIACSGESDGGGSGDASVEPGDGDGDATGDDDLPGDGDGDLPGDGDGTGGTTGDGDLPGDGDGDLPGDGDGTGGATTDDDPTVEVYDGPEPGRVCSYGDELLAHGTTIFSADGCGYCTCWDDGVECGETWECMDGQEPQDCEGLGHRESGVSEGDGCKILSVCNNGQIATEASCPEQPGLPSEGCVVGDVRFAEGERTADGGDLGTCFCLNGKSTCIY